MKPTNARFRPSRVASYFSPTEQFTLGANASQTKSFYGIEGMEFAFNRISIGTLTPDTILVSAKLNNDLTLFENVHVSSLQNMFLMRSLLSPFIIGENNFLQITLTNTSAVATEASFQILGYDHIALAEWRQFINETGRVYPTPVFVTGFDSVAAQTTNKLIKLTRRNRPVLVHRLFIGSNAPSDLRISLEIYNNTIKSDMFVKQLNDEFLAMPALVPYLIGNNIPVNLYVSNKNLTDVRNVSFIGEGYYE